MSVCFNCSLLIQYFESLGIIVRVICVVGKTRCVQCWYQITRGLLYEETDSRDVNCGEVKCPYGLSTTRPLCSVRYRLSNRVLSAAHRHINNTCSVFIGRTVVQSGRSYWRGIDWDGSYRSCDIFQSSEHPCDENIRLSDTLHSGLGKPLFWKYCTNKIIQNCGHVIIQHQPGAKYQDGGTW